jgi:hypothetical protein
VPHLVTASEKIASGCSLPAVIGQNLHFVPHLSLSSAGSSRFRKCARQAGTSLWGRAKERKDHQKSHDRMEFNHEQKRLLMVE